jgi:hypothetical protein
VSARVVRARRPAQHARSVSAIDEDGAARGERRAVGERGRQCERAAGGIAAADRDPQCLADRARRFAIGSSEGSSKPKIAGPPARSSCQTMRVPETSGSR